MTEKQLAANRRNALKSTGPRTARGKARSSRNSVKHGVLTTTPILPGIESREAWAEHRDGILQSLAPVGYLEKLLTVQLASISWRLDRVVRYEAEVAAAAVARSEPDLDERADIGSGKPADPAEASTKAKSTYLIAELLNNLPNMADEKVIETEVAVGAPGRLARNFLRRGMPYPFPVFRMMTMNLTRSVIGPLAFVVRPWKLTLPWLEYPPRLSENNVCSLCVRATTPL